MTTRSLLIRFPGYPFDPALLLPDAELAMIAGTLREQGHRCTILDFGCLEVVRRLAPRWHRPAVERVIDRWLSALDNPEVAARPAALPVAVAAAHAAFLTRRMQLCSELAEDLVRERWVDFLAFKIMTPDDLEAATLIVGEYRKCGGRRPVVAFGRLVQRYGPYLASLRGSVDALCSGPAAGSLLRMAQRVASSRPVDARDLAWIQPAGSAASPGYRPRRESREILPGAMPAYDAEAYPVLQGDAKLKLFSLEDSRGCSCHCNACPHAGSDSYRQLRPAASVAEEARGIATEHGLNAAFFSGSAAPHEHIVAIIEAIQQQMGPIRWGRRLHTPEIGPASLAVWRALGMVSAEFTIDSGSQRLLDDTFGKGLRVSHAEAVVRAGKECGLHTSVGLVFPVPDDDAHTREETLRLLRRARPDALRIAMPEVVPGSHWHAHAAAFGFAAASPWGAESPGPYGALTLQRYPLPPREGGVAPFHHGSLSPSQAVQAHAALLAEVEGMGMPCGLGAQMALAARTAGPAGGEAAWVRSLQRALLLGDTDFAESCLASFNAAVRQPANLVHFPGGAGMPRAVGS